MNEQMKVILFDRNNKVSDILKGIKAMGVSFDECVELNDLRLNKELVAIVETKGFDWIGDVVTVDKGREFYVFLSEIGEEYIAYCDEFTTFVA